MNQITSGPRKPVKIASTCATVAMPRWSSIEPVVAGTDDDDAIPHWVPSHQRC